MNFDSIISLRLTALQRAFVKQQSQAAMMSESDWIRYILFSDAALLTLKQKAAFRRVSDRDLGQVVSVLGQSRIPNNLNQIAKAINMGTIIVSPDTERHIDESYRMVLWIRQTLIQELGLKA
ncbi:MAG: plasmid mobilization relaxosome protein MobC [Pontibacterium sp.]